MEHRTFAPPASAGGRHRTGASPRRTPSYVVFRNPDWSAGGVAAVPRVAIALGAVAGSAAFVAATASHAAPGTAAMLTLAGAGFGGAAATVALAPPVDSAAGRAERVLRALAAGALVAVLAAPAGGGALRSTLAGIAFAAALLGAGTRRHLPPQTGDSADGADGEIDLRDAAADGEVPPLQGGDADLRLLPPETGVLVVVRSSSPFPVLCRTFKRSLDLVGASVALALTAPVVAVVALLISRESPGGWLLRQTRLGMHGRPFTVYKLRTMRAGNDDSEHRAYVAALMRGEAGAHDGLYKLAHDPRVTPLGRWLRKVGVDELPQLVNVLRGEMSLVGPRPPLPSEAALYDERMWQRLGCKPGLTGLWQVSGHNEVPFDEMVDLDIAYWHGWSPLLDLRIITRTLAVVVRARDTA